MLCSFLICMSMYQEAAASCNLVIPALYGLRECCGPGTAFPQVKRGSAVGSLTKGLRSIWFPKIGWLHCKAFMYTFPVAPESADQPYHHAWEWQTHSDDILECIKRSVSQLLVHNPGSGHLQKNSFLRGKKDRGGHRLCTKDCILPVNQSLLSPLALSTQRQTTQGAAYSQAWPGPFRIANHMMVPSLPSAGKAPSTLACVASTWHSWLTPTWLAYLEVLSKPVCQWCKDMWDAPQR